MQHTATTAKDKLLRAGERLFAQKGIDVVRLREINDLAGQRNESALHYHFGSRQGLLEAILAKHRAVLEERRAAMLALFDVGVEPSLRDLVEILVRPLVERLGSPDGRDYLRIVPQVLDGFHAAVRAGRLETFASISNQLIGLIDAALVPLPQEVRRERITTATLLLTAVLAERARLGEGRRRRSKETVFVPNLIDMVTAALSAPTTVAGAVGVRPGPANPASRATRA